MAKKYFTLLLLVAMVTFFVVTNLIWLQMDTLPPAWDQSHHMLLSLQYYRLITQAKSLGNFRQLLSISHYYPPFFHISSVPIISLLGFSEDNLIFTNFLYLILLTLSVFGIGKILFNQRVGIISATLTLFYPIVYALSREYLIDFALLSLVTFIQFLLIKSEGGLKRKWSLLLAIAVGCALLTKPVAIIFIIPLWIFILFRNLDKKKDLFSLLISIIIILLLISPWYISAWKDLFKLTSESFKVGKTIENDPQIFISSIIWYKNTLTNTLISPNLLIFLIIGLVFFWIFNKRWTVFLILVTWVLPAYFIIATSPNKDPRYIMPILPVLAILTIGGIDALPKRNIRNIFYSAIIVISLVQFNNLSFNLPPFLIKERSCHYYNHPPTRQNWKIREIIDYLFNFFGRKNIIIGILPNLQYFNPNPFILYISLMKLPYLVITVGDAPVDLEQLKEYDIFISKTPPISVEWTAFFRDKFYKEFNEISSEKLGFYRIKEFMLPDNSKAIIYKRLK